MILSLGTLGIQEFSALISAVRALIEIDQKVGVVNSLQNLFKKEDSFNGFMNKIEAEIKHHEEELKKKSKIIEDQKKAIQDLNQKTSNNLLFYGRKTKKLIEKRIQEHQVKINENKSADGNLTPEGKKIEIDKIAFEKKLEELDILLEQLAGNDKRREARQRAASWLDKNRTNLAKKAVEFAIQEDPKLKHPGGGADTPANIERFELEIRNCLEVISGCLNVEDDDLINGMEKPPAPPATAYELALNYIQGCCNHDSEAAKEQADYFDYLIKKIQQDWR